MGGESLERVFRAQAGGVLATLLRLIGDFDLAEEALQDAFAAALVQWPARFAAAGGAPPNPRAWPPPTGSRPTPTRSKTTCCG